MAERALSLVQGIEELEELRAPLGEAGDPEDVLIGVGIGLGATAIFAAAYDIAVATAILALT